MFTCSVKWFRLIHNDILCRTGTTHRKRGRTIIESVAQDEVAPATIIWFLIWIRISELVNITMEDLDSRDEFIRVTGKGQKQRLVPISHLTRREIIRYVNRFRQQICADKSPYLFAAPDGRPISLNGVQQLLRRLGKQAGLNGIRCSPHTFRHTFATQFLTNGGDVFALKNIMGHASLHTTLKYTHLQPQDLQNQHAMFSPVTNLSLGRGMHRGRGQGE